MSGELLNITFGVGAIGLELEELDDGIQPTDRTHHSPHPIILPPTLSPRILLF
jgi:hypothetical protein